MLLSASNIAKSSRDAVTCRKKSFSLFIVHCIEVPIFVGVAAN